MNKKASRQRRARKTRARIAEQRIVRLAINRTNLHIYAQVISACGGKILASASSAEAEVRKELASGSNVAAAAVIGKRIAEKAKAAGITQVAFDRSGNRYHGRVKALAEAAREHGLQF
ncbi:MAG: 50S ribosomal protein L18 [Gallionella sp.]|nr:50S ribosomal protein L18 [Gallionella sp.]MDD4946965.1 50S ribosomal protein L18 [Gallionella sp.]MDD5611508.1 50S ribosomal protein L18 [Gallionella sp.]